MSNIAIAKKEYLRINLDKKTTELKNLLLSDKRVEEFKANIIALLANQEIAKCDEKSIFVVAYNIAQLRLAPQQVLGQAYVVPRKNKNGVYEATLQIGYKGWEVIAERAGKRVGCKIIYDSDYFDETADNTGITLSYKPQPKDHPVNNEDIWKKLVGVVVWVTENNITVPEFVPYRIIRKRYEASKKSMFGKESPAWTNWLEEMIIAKALKYVLTKLPLDIMNEKNETLAQAITVESEELPQEELSEEEIKPLEIDAETGEVLEVETKEEQKEEVKPEVKEPKKAKQEQSSFIDKTDDDSFYANK